MAHLRLRASLWFTLLRPALLWPGLLLLCLLTNWLPRTLGAWLGHPPDLGETSLWQLTLTHLGLVLGAEAIVLVLALPLIYLVTRPHWSALRQLTELLVSLGQTVPTLALLALAVPTLGLGLRPTLLGLVLYGLLPVVSGGIAGLHAVDPAVKDAARGMGLTPWQVFWQVEWPLALPALLGGIRTSTVYNVGTATVGAALGAGGLGLPIINGLSQQDAALVLVGAILSALLALSLDSLLALLPHEQNSGMMTKQ